MQTQDVFFLMDVGGISAEDVVWVILTLQVFLTGFLRNTSVGSEKQEKNESSISDNINSWKNDVEDDWNCDALQLYFGAQWNFTH